MTSTETRPAVVVVSHSHWDREWYLPKETFRYHLCNMVEDLLDLVERDPDYRHFMLDGQASLLDDIEAVRPELLPRLRGHVEAGRISVGPWYVLQDEFLVSGESLARNLLVGRQVSQKFGAPMSVGYVPDAFGHVSQIPRMLQGFGIESAVFWRGAGGREDTTEWRWRAPGGAEVLCMWLKWSYGFAANLADDSSQVVQRFGVDLDRMLTSSPAKVLIWMNGADHLWPQAHLPAMLEAIREAHPGVDVIHGGLPLAESLVRERLDVGALPVVDGEMRHTGPAHGFLLPGVLSARSWQQRDHDAAEWRLVREAEPLATLAGISADQPLDLAWRTLLKCQPHDSICGCSTDEVHQEVDVRIARTSQLATAIREHAILKLADDPAAREVTARRHGDLQAIVLSNPHPFETPALATLTLHRGAEEGPFRLMGPDGEVAHAIVGDVLADQTLSWAGLEEAPMDNPEDLPPTHRELTVQILAEALPPLGIQILRIEDAPPTDEKIPPMAERVENEHIALEAIPGGIAILDRSTGERVEHTFEDVGDRGDEYNFCSLAGEAIHRSDAIDWRVEKRADATATSLTLTGTWRLPRTLSDDRAERVGDASVAMRLEAQLTPGIRGVALDLRIDNEALDHRLRARFSSSAHASAVADAPFDWIERSPQPNPGAPDALEMSEPTFPLSSMVTQELTHARYGVGTLGLKEGQLEEDGTLLITILRSVGWLSRGDMAPHRPRHAGPALATPGAQGLGEHRFPYALAFGEQGEDPASLHRILEPLLFPPSARAVPSATVQNQSLLAVEPASIRLAAIKRSASGDAIVVRLMGAASGAPQTTKLTLWRPIEEAWLSDLDERSGPALPVHETPDGSAVRVDVPSRDVVTVAIRLGED
jgi:hypothetical protein